MEGFGFSPLQLALFFASTVFVVFGAGLLAPRLAHRFGALRAARAGIAIAFAAGATLLAAPEQVYYFSAALTVFLIGMGLINPLGTAVTLEPFGQSAGAASALLGFLQMGCAAISIAITSALSLSPHLAFSVVIASSLLMALVTFAGALKR